MVDGGQLEQLAGAYRRWAEDTRGRSPLYEELARAVAEDRALLRVLAELPQAKQQPNLLFAGVRFLRGTADGWPQFRRWFFERREEVLAVMLARRTQTNVPARCASLLPLLAMLPQPLALLEVGAAAGLCLLPDRYAYEFNAQRVAPSQPVGVEAPTFVCRASRSTPLPARNVEVVWRAGLDLDPIDVRDAGQVAWLEALVWPGEGQRLELLRAAVEVALADPPPLVCGDLRYDLPGLARRAPPDATLVIFHSAVLAYIPDPADRAAFANTISGLNAVWVANEGHGLVDGTDPPRPPWPTGDRFLLTRDRHPVAWTDGHGASIQWIA